MNVEYHSEFYNKIEEQEQWIRLSDGCFRNITRIGGKE